VLVGTGILLSRLVGLVRQRALAHYFGLGDTADAFNAAFRIPNFLQNLFGEGVLSASFIPVYARLRAERQDKEAVRVANAVLGLLALFTSGIVLIGMLGAPVLTDVIAPGFSGDKRALTIQLVRILFPGAGLLVLSAWCLGVLNSHRRFFLSYAAPVAWNLAIIIALVGFGRSETGDRLAIVAAWGSLIGSAFQFAVQLPSVIGLLGALRPALDRTSESIRTVIRNFVPVFVGRGVVQISAFVDTILASLLPGGAVAALANAQTLYTLPVSLFGMSVSAAELPEMSGTIGEAHVVHRQLQVRLEAGLKHIAFFVVPCAAAFLVFGDAIAGALFQSGRFGADDSRYVWGILAGSAVGLLATTLGRLYASTFYALRDTRTPLRFAVIRVLLTSGLGYLCAVPLPGLIGVDSKWGAAGLTASAGIAAWVEFNLLRRSLSRRIGSSGLRYRYVLILWLVAATSSALVWAGARFLPPLHPIPRAIILLTPFTALYVSVLAGLGVPEAVAMVNRLRGRRG
jgi:putative peptidoglycan lipid II flippase